MVAENCQVVAESIHHLHLGLTFVEGEEEGALHGVAGIDEKHIFLCAAYAVDKGFAPLYAAETFVVGVNLAVCIIGLEYHKVGCRQG